jgi:hypothetical protein
MRERPSLAQPISLPFSPGEQAFQAMETSPSLPSHPREHLPPTPAASPTSIVARPPASPSPDRHVRPSPYIFELDAILQCRGGDAFGGLRVNGQQIPLAPFRVIRSSVDHRFIRLIPTLIGIPKCPLAELYSTLHCWGAPSPAAGCRASGSPPRPTDTDDACASLAAVGETV